MPEEVGAFGFNPPLPNWRNRLHGGGLPFLQFGPDLQMLAPLCTRLATSTPTTTSIDSWIRYAVQEPPTAHYPQGGGFYTLRLTPILVEGFTEYFTRMLMREQSTVLGPVGMGAYQSQYEAAHLIISNMRPPSAAESAYFHGPSADIRKVREGIQYVEQNPDAIRMLQSIGAAVRTLMQSIGTNEIKDALRGVGAPARHAPPRRNRMRLRTLQDVQER